ncbi:hypothetical protein [Thalassobacillus sp. CUG 92003]|uniref:hypothetical protein n=1 Tax=Thalassobacillus sp. CUG 92003 TaxID=2736641 RepID=UPI0015E6F484|nr:hypothetical protein [Thalassobacillus sp. CUG 92003]
MEQLRLNVALLRRRVPNLTNAAKSVGLRPATVSNLCTGKIPVGRSEVRTLVALASLAECSLDELIMRGEKVDMIETGIKTLDVFAPLAKGGTIGLVARPGMGQLVVLAELFYRVKQTYAKTVLLEPEAYHAEVEELKADVDRVCLSIDEAYEELAKTDSAYDVLFAADRSHVVTGEIYRLQDRLLAAGEQHVTTLLLDLKGEAVDDDFPYGPLETLWQFDADLAARQLFPSINPLHSTSSVLEGAHTDQTHLSIQQRAQKLLRRYYELRSFIRVGGMERLPSAEVDTYHRGERLEAYLTQPLYVAEALTGQKGTRVNLQEALQDVRKILEGAADHFEVAELKYTGSIS